MGASVKAITVALLQKGRTGNIGEVLESANRQTE